MEGMCSKINLQCLKRALKSNLLIILILLAVNVGIILGLSLRSVWTYEDYRYLFYLEFPGRIFLNMLKVLILPLVISSLITGMAGTGSETSGRLGAAAMLYYMSTTMTAVIVGIILVLSIHPGNVDSRRIIKTKSLAANRVSAIESMLDLISQCFPENLVAACVERVVTSIELVPSAPIFNETSNTTYRVMLKKPKMSVEGGTNVLGIVVSSIAFGCVINYLGEQGVPLGAFFQSLNSVTMVLIRIVIWFTPIGITFLIASKFVSTSNITEAITGLGMYMFVVMSGLIVHGVIFLPTLYFVLTRNNPFTFAVNMGKALLTAWATGSSSATLPITMECLINNNKININIVRFVAPVGATINMDGTALYEAVACIFIAQVNGIYLSFADVIIVSLTATAAAVGAAGIPQAGLVTMVIVLTAVGLPAEDISLILSIDWLLDRFRTMVNVWGDCIGAGILDNFFIVNSKSVRFPTTTSSRIENVEQVITHYPLADKKVSAHNTGSYTRDRKQSRQSLEYSTEGRSTFVR